MGVPNYGTLFAELGRAVYWSDFLIAQQNTIYLAAVTGMAADFQNLFGSFGDFALIPNIQTIVQSFANAMAGQVQTPVQIANNVLANLQADLNAPGTQPQQILPLLYADMVANNETVEHNVINAAVITPAASNVGNGVLVASNLNVLGITDERIFNQTVSFVCTQSLYSGGVAGGERFSVNGFPSLPSPAFYGPLGTGNPSSLTVADSQNRLTNGNFETWSGSPNAPQGWTVVAGTLVTNIVQNTANPHTGLSALEMLGDGATTTVSISQNIASQARANTVYCLSCWLRKAGSVSAGSTITISIQGTGAVTQTAVSLDPSTLTTAYQLFHIFYSSASNLGNGIPADYVCKISWTAANAAGSGAQVLIDDVVLVTPVVYGFTSYVLLAGSTGFVVGDSFTSTTSVYSSGAFQSWLARFMGAVLPSSPTPSIPDSLATNPV